MTKTERREKKVQHCKKLLDALGQYSSDEIADILCMNGIRGMRKAILRCPLAMYLRSEGVDCPVVKPGAVGVARGGIIYDIPVSVNDFISKFDSGSYEHLADYDEDVSYE